MDFELVWFDSFGAKSSCVLVETKDVSVLIDPGVAIMHRSFPASLPKKLFWLEKGWHEVEKAARRADVVVVTHYHYDHHSPDRMHIYEGKLLLVKDPNKYINDSQRGRALRFFENLWRRFGGQELKPGNHQKREEFDRADVLDVVKLSEMDEEHVKWFQARVKKWKSYRKIEEAKFDDLEIRFADNLELSFGRTKLKTIGPIFHCVECSRVGWVFMVVVEEGSKKLLYSSDLCGPIIEKYAEVMISEKPNYLVVDGPNTYMLGYLLSSENLMRAINNACRMIQKMDFELFIWDHHLPREPRFRENTAEVWKLAKKLGKDVMTAREFKENKPAVVEELMS